MGKAKKKPKNDQRSSRQKLKVKKVQQQITKKVKVAKKTDHQSVYLLNEKVVELGGGTAQKSVERLDDDVEEKPVELSNDKTERKLAESLDDDMKTKPLEQQDDKSVEYEGLGGTEVDIAETETLGEKDEAEENGSEEAEDEDQGEGAGKSERLERSEKPTTLSERKLGVARRLHALNIDYPWLKILGVVILLFLVIGGLVMALQPKDVISGGETGTSAEIDESVSEESREEPSEQDEDVTDGSAESGTSQEVDAPSTQPEVNVTPGSKLIALTFDDGPSGATTPRLLDILAQKQVKATFFVLGSMAQRAPDIVKRAEAEGHEVGSHTPWHDNLVKLSAADIQAQAATMNQIMTEILGHGLKLTRPPYGSVDQKVRDNLGQPLIIWSIDPEDWKYRDAATVRANVVNNAFDGAIILMHDIYGSTVDAVAGIIDDLRAQGYEFLTISELARVRGVSFVNGTSYFYFKP